MRVLAVASELFPLVKTGGLADVTGALPLALAAEGVAVTTLLPGYPAVLAGLEAAEAVHQDAGFFGGAARLLRGRAAGLDLLVLDAPHLYARDGGPYAGPAGDWPDNAIRFGALGNMAACVCHEGLGGVAPDVVHAHDWQAGLAMAYLRYFPGRRVPGVMTVHNLAFQGLYPGALLGALGLPDAAFTPEGVEFHGMVGFLKAGLALADRITTVSPRYAAEIQTDALGMGLEGLLRHRAAALTGIVNGIDTRVWDPAADGLIAARFDAGDVGPRAVNKAWAQARFGLARDPGALLFGVVSRLTWQKGLDLLLEGLDELLGLSAQLVVLGSGERDLEAGFAGAAAAHPGRIGCVIGYDEALAHAIQAGVDALLVPSRFEPCGLTQLCALRYGALPVVARVGGLADTVTDGVTGLQFDPGELRPALRRAAALWRAPEAWRACQTAAMAADVSWRQPARAYAALYRDLASTDFL